MNQLVQMKYKLLSTVILIASVTIGCSANARPNMSAEDCDIKVGLQLQKAVSLTAIRYANLLDDLQKGSTDEARNDIDYWLDLAIAELQFLEESHPNYRWDEVVIKELDEFNIKMRKFYGDIARYRLKYPREHKIPLDDDIKRVIDAFVEKYK